MKRLTIFAVLLIVATTSTGCGRGLRNWCCRGVRCAPAPAATPVPVYYTPQYCPPPAVCPPATTTYSVPTFSDGGAGCETPIYGGSVGYDAGTPVVDPQGFSTVPANTPPAIPDGASLPKIPPYAQVIADRKLEDGEQMTTPVALPVSSARKASSQLNE